MKKKPKGDDDRTDKLEEKKVTRIFVDLQEMHFDTDKVDKKTSLSKDLEKIASDEGFIISGNPASGNCMFYALCEQLQSVKGIKLTHTEVRKTLVQFLKEKSCLDDGTPLFNFVCGYLTWREYLISMSKDGTWGDHLVLLAAANYYRTDIRVISSLGRDVLISPDRPVNTSPLVLGHIHEEHYVSLHPKQEMQTNWKDDEENTQDKPRENKDAFNPAEFIDGFRQLYKIRERWLAPFPWCKEFRFHLDNIFTRLKMVINNEESGTMTVETVDMFDVFKSPKEWRRPKRVLIQGNPGIGKTTYCAKLAYDWATRTHEQEGSFPNFQVVLLLNCRDIMSGLWKAIDYQLLPQDIQEKAKDEFFKFIRINQSNVLLILDGLDELPSSQLPEILSIIEGRVLPNWHIVVTTREMAVGHYCDTVLEIKGFAEADSRMFITDYFGTMDDLAQKLLEKLEKDKQLRDMTANPFLTAVLCLLCEELEGVFQENGTQLYLEMVQCILRRYATKKELALHTEDLIGLYKAQLKDLGSIALNCLLEGSTYFEKRQLQNFASDLPGFGFLSAQREIIPWRPGIRYGFLHKSFQELFAAFYLGCQLIDGEISPESLLADTRYFRELKQVLLFTCGILAAQCEETAVALIKCIIRQVNKGGDDDFVTALYCINECKKEQSNLYIELARILAISSYLQLQNVGLKGRRLNDAPATVLAEAIKTNSTSLSKLDLSENEIGEAGTAALAEAIKLSSTLTVLNLSENGICDTGAAALAEGIKLNSTISELNLSHNEIGDTGAAALAEGMKLNSTLTELNLSQNRIGDTGAFALGEGMKLNATLTELNLSHNEIGDPGAVALAEEIILNATLTSSMVIGGMRPPVKFMINFRQISKKFSTNFPNFQKNLSGHQSNFLSNFSREIFSVKQKFTTSFFKFD